MSDIVERLLASDEPSVRLGTLTGVVRADTRSSQVRAAVDAVTRSQRVATLLSERGEDGCIPAHPYAKWHGAHWVLVALADIGYPPGDRTLEPLRDQMLAWLFSDDYIEEKIGTVKGHTRLHASIDGNLVWSTLKLGISNARTEALVERLIGAQWPDGGWNCDRDASGRSSSFTESLVPLRALALHARLTKSPWSRAATERAAEFFLAHRLYRRLRGGSIVNPNFVKLHYPCYWHYDVLFGLKVINEAGFISDPRCDDALDLLEHKRLPDGGFPAEARYYRPPTSAGTGRSLVDWGGVSARRMNEFVTVDALTVLTAAGRI